KLLSFTQRSRAIFGDIYYRILIIQSLISLVNHKWNKLKNLLDDHTVENEFEDDGILVTRGYGYEIDNSLRYEIVAHLMNIFYQLNSCNEMLIKLATKTQVAIDSSISNDVATRYFIDLVEKELGVRVEYKRLRKFRNQFTHHSTM
ncbi:hypothetical protein, partial [Petrocella sp. FN5]|uniref:hypothetical protein n=1 Tax=Petrocella sp. FN5 TaxID=3032002 RepID=UPI0023DA0EBE